MSKKPSRTLSAAVKGLYALLGLSLIPFATMIVSPESMDSMAEVISTIALAVAAVASGGTVAVGARHWGAKESSSYKRPEDDFAEIPEP